MKMKEKLKTKLRALWNEDFYFNGFSISLSFTASQQYQGHVEPVS